MELLAERAAFLAAEHNRISQARQRAALQLACGIDLDEALSSIGPARQKLLARVRRELRRERLKALTRHWSYRLDRHIALKQVLDRLDAVPSCDDPRLLPVQP